ncbi:hypothetical protein KKA15_04820 [Patescibacteria group bacterium]|nr:hypothetical protein [Patescibacteria group bacterium]
MGERLITGESPDDETIDAEFEIIEDEELADTQARDHNGTDEPQIVGNETQQARSDADEPLEPVQEDSIPDGEFEAPLIARIFQFVRNFQFNWRYVAYIGGPIVAIVVLITCLLVFTGGKEKPDHMAEMTKKLDAMSKQIADLTKSGEKVDQLSTRVNQIENTPAATSFQPTGTRYVESLYEGIPLSAKVEHALLAYRHDVEGPANRARAGGLIRNARDPQSRLQYLQGEIDRIKLLPVSERASALSKLRLQIEAIKKEQQITSHMKEWSATLFAEEIEKIEERFDQISTQ